jgi:hypothetical protein
VSTYDYLKAKPIIEKYVMPAILDGYEAAKRVVAADSYVDAQLYGFAFWKLIYKRLVELALDPDSPVYFYGKSRFIFLIEGIPFRVHRADYLTGSPISGKTIKSYAVQCNILMPGLDFSSYVEHYTTILGIVAPVSKGLQQVFLGKVIVDDFSKKRFKSVEKVFVYDIFGGAIGNEEIVTHDMESIVEPTVSFVPVEKEANTIVRLEKAVLVQKKLLKRSE